jgi:hypothetical protein
LPAIQNCTATSASWAGEMRGHEMHFEHQRMLYETDAKTPEIHYRGGKILNQFDAIILELDLVLLLRLCTNQTI